MITTLSLLIAAFTWMTGSAEAQDSRDLQYFRAPDKSGLNVFEAPRTTDVMYDGFRLRIGGANTMQFQGLSQSGNDDLAELATNFNLPTANIDFDVQLHDGVRMHLRSWVASPGQGASFHVKGGYIQIDRLDFIQQGFLGDAMDNLRVRIGHMDFNYGDAHFRRSDNAQTMHNPFVGNYIMDSYTNEIGGELYYLGETGLAMIGVTNSRMNQSTIAKQDEDFDDAPQFFGKVGFDSQVNDDLRIRLTGSALTVSQTESHYLWGGDRAGARYYNVLGGGDRAPRFDPDFDVSRFAPHGPVPNAGVTAVQINPFIKFGGLEFFGIYELANGKQLGEDDRRTFNQYAGELVYRFGADERFYLGSRYNMVTGELADGSDITIDRFNIGGGWFMADNFMTKLEYVTQTHDGFPGHDARRDAEFGGIMMEAVISF